MLSTQSHFQGSISFSSTFKLKKASNINVHDFYDDILLFGGHLLGMPSVVKYPFSEATIFLPFNSDKDGCVCGRFLH